MLVIFIVIFHFLEGNLYDYHFITIWFFLVYGIPDLKREFNLYNKVVHLNNQYSVIDYLILDNFCFKWKNQHFCHCYASWYHLNYFIIVRIELVIWYYNHYVGLYFKDCTRHGGYKMCCFILKSLKIYMVVVNVSFHFNLEYYNDY